MIFRFVTLMLVTSLWTFEKGRAASGVIWSKERENFVQLYSIPRFGVFHEEIQERSRATEKYRFNGQTVNLLIQQPKFARKLNIDSPSVEIWHVLKEQLNITLTINFAREILTTDQDLLRVMKENNTHIIFPVFYKNSTMKLFHFTSPIITLKNTLNVQPKKQHQFFGIFGLFSTRSWCYLFIFYILLSLIDFVYQKISLTKLEDDSFRNFNVNDYFLYTLGAICSQGYIPDDYRKNFKILYIAKQIFVLLIYTYYASFLIYHLSTITEKEPFEDIKSLLINTNYTILVSTKGSIDHIVKGQGSMVMKQMHITEDDLLKRFHYTDNLAWIVKKVCAHDSKYAWLGIQRQLGGVSSISCNIMKLKEISLLLYVTGIVDKNSPYRRTIDIAIMRQRELGLASHWLQHVFPCYKAWLPSPSFGSITLDQVGVIFLILWIGTIASLIIFAIERIMFSYDLKKKD